MKTTLGILLLALALFSAQQAKADLYLGGLIGYGFESGNGGSNPQGGVAAGGTAGINLTPNLGVAFTYLHNFESVNGVSNSTYAVSQFMGELNFFSLFFFPSGVHVGQVHTNYSLNGTSLGTNNDLGFGVHTGLETHLTANITIGAAVYWTYVDNSDDKHSVFDIVAPIKFHF